MYSHSVVVSCHLMGVESFILCSVMSCPVGGFTGGSSEDRLTVQ